MANMSMGDYAQFREAINALNKWLRNHDLALLELQGQGWRIGMVSTGKVEGGGTSIAEALTDALNRAEARIGQTSRGHQ